MPIFQRGKTWWGSYTTPSGERIRTSLKTTDKKEAEEVFDKIRHDMWRKEHVGAGNLKKTWDEAALRWLDEKAHKRSIHDDARMLEKLQPFFKGKRLSAMSSEFVVNAVQNITKGETAQNRYIALVRGIFHRAERHWRWIEKSPAFTLNREAKRRIRWLTQNEAVRLLNELPEHLKDMAEFTLHTGLRKSNVTGLRWDSVNMGSRTAYISCDEFKNGQEHAVPLNEDAMAVIRRRIGSHPTHVFSFNGSPIQQCNTAAWYKALKRAGIIDFRWHDLRHTWASWMAQAGTPLHILQELGGWESASMVKRYAHFSRAHLAEYAGKIGGMTADSSGMGVGTNLAQYVPKNKTGSMR